MELKGIIEIVKYALDAQSSMEGASAGATDLSIEFRKKLNSGSLSQSDVEDWLKAIESNLKAGDAAAADFYGAVRLLGHILKPVE